MELLQKEYRRVIIQMQGTGQGASPERAEGKDSSQ